MAALRRPSLLAKPWTCTTCLQTRPLHKLAAPTLQTPQPTPFVPDTQTFLTLIGRNMSTHSAKIPTWEALFNLSSAELKSTGVEPARARRYLLWWRERYRDGIMGIGGDLTNVKDGVAELRVVEVPSSRGVDRSATLTKGPGTRKIVVNVEPTVILAEDPVAKLDEKEGEEKIEGAGEEEQAAAAPKAKIQPLTPLPMEMDVAKLRPVAKVKVVGSDSIAGTGVEPVKGYRGVARLKVKDGLWEIRRGHKVDGGERRQAMVRSKRRAAERKDGR